MKLNRHRMARLGLVIGLLLSLLWGGGCAQQTGGIKRPEADTQIITDCLGRQVPVPLKVERIACLCPESGYTLVMLGQGDKIVAVTNGLKRDIILTEMYPAIKDAVVPKLSESINIEELVKIQPDVVFVKNDASISGAEAEKLNKSQVPFLVVTYNSMAEQQYAIEMIGKVVGAYDKARQYNSFYQASVDRVQVRLAELPVEQRIRVYHSVNEATRTDNKGSLAADWTKAAGAINVSVNQELKFMAGDYYAGLEQILLWDPEVILANEGGVVDYIMGNAQWAPILAVKNSRVYKLPSGVSRWGHPSSPETPMVILWTAKTLYPDLFIDLDLTLETRKFYQQFYGLQLSDEMIASIISGAGMRAPR